jgi:effector-binding domain-containing protein
VHGARSQHCRDVSARYCSREAELTLAELDDFLESAILELTSDDATGPPFAIFHGPVDESTRSRVEVGVPVAGGDRVLEGGHVVHASAIGHTGYDPIHGVYDAISAFIGEHGLKQRGPTREVYRGRERFSDEIEVVWPVEAPSEAE